MHSKFHGIMSLTIISSAWLLALGVGLKYRFYIGLLCVTMTLLGIVWILEAIAYLQLQPEAES